MKVTAMLMNKNDSILLIIDVQENLAPAQESPREVINGCEIGRASCRERVCQYV